ncbi:MAG: tRNA lysidine(34) synthetase TilS [Proteobacteria bacterium]|nr:tRNA lysidine(34) synthetase TilS [Pseudomonadota bacterium]
MNARFAAALAALGVPEDEAIGVAVSGGPDSLALLLLAAEAQPGRVRAATVDHGLRPEARAEADAVAAVCARLGVPHAILSVAVEGSVQAGARAARYAALADWCRAQALNWLATAHHADDQAETLLMRIARGAGLSGLAGVRARRPLSEGVTLIRPLLDWRKAELETLAAPLSPALDPSNADPAYDRTAARALLASTPWLEAERLAASAAHLAEAEAALHWAADQAFAERVRDDTLDPAGLPPEIVRRLVLHIFAAFGEAPRGPELARLIAALQEGRAVTLGTVKASPGRRWTFAPAPPRRTG